MPPPLDETPPDERRLDIAAGERGLARSRTQAAELIRSGQMAVNGRVIRRPAYVVTPRDLVTLEGEACPFVGRGGLKLAAALTAFAVRTERTSWLDIGSSTGGFTDCLLRAGASRVVGIDVGHGQLAETLAADPRVENHEGVNARELKDVHFGTPFDGVAIDVSFISITLILERAAAQLAPGGTLIALIKPQFEVGAGRLGKGGIVREEAGRRAAVERAADFGRTACGLRPRGSIPSPISGGDGNVEYLACFLKEGTDGGI